MQLYIYYTYIYIEREREMDPFDTDPFRTPQKNRSPTPTLRSPRSGPASAE